MSEPLRVLVADDNDTDRLLLATILRREGYQVQPAVDGLDALARFESFQPHLVLLDALMPGLDGFEVAREIKAKSGDDFIPIIFLTSLTEADELARCVDAGGDDFLSKPYNQVILKAKLSALERVRLLHVTTQQQRDEITRHHAHLLQEQEAAKAVFDKVAHTGNLDVPYIKHLISPLAIFNGDVLLAAANPSGDLYLLLGDFTGHGLAAAIGAMPLAEIFYGMTQKGFSISEILREANRKLQGILPKGYFCCVLMASCNFRKKTVEFWNGGLPPAALVRRDGSALVHLESRHLPLGIQGDGCFDNTTNVLEMNVGDRLVLCTDGVIEARNAEGELFGFDRFYEVIQQSAREDNLFERVKSAVYHHMGATSKEDDITLAEFTMVDVDASQVANGMGTPLPASGSEDWKLIYELGPGSLKQANPLPLMQYVLMEVPQLRPHAGEIYTVLAELYSNALEHGVMGLDSNLKSTPDGFARYYQTRAEALKSLQGTIRFEFDCLIQGEEGRLCINVTDSGAGFDFHRRLEATSAMATTAYHGRGIRLLEQLCQAIEYKGRGNQVEVVFSWSNKDE